jgi:uncharacterized MAPEG superfamily protein
MTATALAVVGYIGCTLCLNLVNEVVRSYLVLTGRKGSNSFRSDGADVSPFAHRLARAHANCYESFPVIAGLLLLALATGQSEVTDSLALWVLAARVAQSSTHLISTSNLAVNIRFSFFSVQLLIAAWWVIRFLVQWTAA